MTSTTKKTVMTYAMLIMASLYPHGNAQQQQILGTTNNMAYPPPRPTYMPVAKGYSTVPIGGNIGYYYNHPINAQYWTGHGSQLLPSPQFQTQYQQQYYQQYPQQYYPQTGYQPNMYTQNGYQQYYGNQQYYGFPMTGNRNTQVYYPRFDASYWNPNAVNHNGQMMPIPVYPHQFPVAQYPAQYYPNAHPAQYYPNAHPAQYYQNAYQPGYPYMYRRPSFVDHIHRVVTSKTGKTLLGALAVGIVAGKVARKGK